MSSATIKDRDSLLPESCVVPRQPAESSADPVDGFPSLLSLPCFLFAGLPSLHVGTSQPSPRRAGVLDSLRGRDQPQPRAGSPITFSSLHLWSYRPACPHPASADATPNPGCRGISFVLHMCALVHVSLRQRAPRNRRTSLSGARLACRPRHARLDHCRAGLVKRALADDARGPCPELDRRRPTT